ncbi:MAG: 3'-5' exonuclease [Oscillospiraceae bacterium]|nr:3'-5' exonuclease [Oscillospiraceae bacterium]
MAQRYVVFDVETPNRWNNRMSAIGVTVVEDGRITDSFFSYIDPEQPFDAFNTMLTGISEETVFDAPSFPELWPRLEPLLSSGVLVAHNASFDLGVLRKCLSAYGIAWKPCVRGICTVIMGRSLLPGISHKLNDLCETFGICLNHHQADSDSRACAEILLRYIERGADPDRYIRTYRLGE